MRIPNHDARLLRGSEPKESGRKQVTWTITLTTDDYVADEYANESRLDDEYHRICEALSKLKLDAKVEISEDPEEEWL